MSRPLSLKNQERGAAEGKVQLSTGIGLKLNSSGKRNNEGNIGERGKNTLTLIPSGKRLSDVSIGGSTVTSTCHQSDSGSVLASPEVRVASSSASPRQNELIHSPKREGRRTWVAVPSIGELEKFHSDSKGVVVTPDTAAYTRRSAQESQVSGPTTARSMGTARTVALGEESPDWAGLKAIVKKEGKKTEVDVPSPGKGEKIEEEVSPHLEEERPSIERTPRVRRQPWIGPAYTAVHTPPYAGQTCEYGQTEKLDLSQTPKHLSYVERFVLEESIENVGRRQYASLSGRPHFTPYVLRAPAVGSYLEDYAVPPSQKGHSFDKDPLLRSVLTPQDNFPYIREQATYHGQPLNYTHNDWMLDNVMDTTTAQKCCPGTVPAYADIPHLGRVQCTYLRQPDGTVYPLVTLPKMTPHDILKVLERVKRSKFGKRRKQPIWRRLFCCGVADTGEA